MLIDKLKFTMKQSRNTYAVFCLCFYRAGYIHLPSYRYTLICLIATCCFTIIGVIIAVVAGGTNNIKTSSHRSVTSVGEFVAQLGQLIDANIPLLNHGILGFDRLIHKLQLIAKHLDVLTMLFYFLQLLINRLNKRLPILLIALNLCKKCCHIMYWARHFHHNFFQSRLHTKPRNRTNSAIATMGNSKIVWTAKLNQEVARKQTKCGQF